MMNWMLLFLSWYCLFQLILKSLSSCDSETQNRMLQQLTVLYSSNELEKIFHLGESVKNDLRSTLNRLTTETLIDVSSK